MCFYCNKYGDGNGYLSDCEVESSVSVTAIGSRRLWHIWESREIHVEFVWHGDSAAGCHSENSGQVFDVFRDHRQVNVTIRKCVPSCLSKVIVCNCHP